jgi:E3 ubiquitin-protein ligase MYCBP2
MHHPAIEDILKPVLELEKNIHSKAMQRLQYENRDKDAAVTKKGEAFYNDPVGYAMKQYLFYMCFKCQNPYFAGGYQCQEANEAFDPAELLCPSCQPSSIEDCPTHGKDWLAYKCRFCCSFANWYCWGTTHFCVNCHKSGVWQNNVHYRTGKNKKNFGNTKIVLL